MSDNVFWYNVNYISEKHFRHRRQFLFKTNGLAEM